MSILIANGRQRNIEDFTYYGEGPGKEGDKDNTSALSVDLERGVVTARQWDLRDFRDEDPDSEPEWGMQEVRIDLDDLMRSGTKSSKFRQTYSGDLGWTLEDVRAMSKKDRQNAIVSVAISRIGYGPNDESIVEGIGSTDEVYRNNARRSARRRNPEIAAPVVAVPAAPAPVPAAVATTAAALKAAQAAHAAAVEAAKAPAAADATKKANPAGRFAFHAPIYRRVRGRTQDVGIQVITAPTFEAVLEEIRKWLKRPQSLQGRQEGWPAIPAHAVQVFRERAPGYINTEDLVAYVDVADGDIADVRKKGTPSWGPAKGESGFARLTKNPAQPALPSLGVFVGRLAADSHDPGRAVTYRVTLHGEDAALAYSLLQHIGPAYQWDVRGSEFIFVGATALHALLTALLKVQGKEHDRAVNLVRQALDRLGF